MNFEISAVTDIGISKDKNQDSYHVRRCEIEQEQIVFAVLSDGMGGLMEGEIASTTVVKAFCRWADARLPVLRKKEKEEPAIYQEWMKIVDDCNKKLQFYGREKGIHLGTTATAMLFWKDTYYIVHIGDSRAYEISDEIKILTTDHTLVAREVALGRLTQTQADVDSRRHILLQCIGESDIIFPEFVTGKIKKNAVYILCSDGFRHEITSKEIFRHLNSNEIGEIVIKKKDLLHDAQIKLYLNMKKLVELNKQRNERDNITVIGIRTGEQEKCYD